MKSKIAIAFTVIGLMAGRTYAQQTPEDTENIDYFEKVEKYRKMKSTGAVLTVVGSILVVVGMSAMYNAMDEFDDSTDSGIVGGTLCAIAGYGMLGPGVPMWIVGGVQHKKYSMKARELGIKVNATPQSQGLTLVYRF